MTSYPMSCQAALYKHVNDTATKFTDAEGKGRYVTAAKNFCLPYWGMFSPFLCDNSNDIHLPR